MLDRQRFDLGKIDEMIVSVDAILDRVEPFPRHGGARAVRQVTTGVEAHPKDCLAGLDQREHHGRIGLRARMRLDVGETAIEQLLGALDGECLDCIRRGAALIVALAGIALGIFVGEHRALCFEHGLRNDIFGGDQLDLMPLAINLAG